MKIVYVGGPVHRQTCRVKPGKEPPAISYVGGSGMFATAYQYILQPSGASGISPLAIASLMGDDPDVDTSRVYLYGGPLT